MDVELILLYCSDQFFELGSNQLASYILITLGVIVAVIVYFIPHQRLKIWIALISIWLSIPVTFIIDLNLGRYVASLGDCRASAAVSVDCIVYGYDVSDWINGLYAYGYAFAFFAAPWFIVGGIILVLYILVKFVFAEIWHSLKRKR